MDTVADEVTGPHRDELAIWKRTFSNWDLARDLLSKGHKAVAQRNSRRALGGRHETLAHDGLT